MGKRWKSRKRSSSFGRSSRRETAWYRHYGGTINVVGSGTEYGSIALMQGQQFQNQSTTAPTIVLEMSQRDITLKRLIFRISVSLIVGAAAAIKFYFGVWKASAGGASLTAPVFDPRINVGSAAVQAANASCDWLYLHQLDCLPAAGGPYGLAQLLGQGPIVLDIRAGRKLATDSLIGFSAGFAGMGMAALNPGTSAAIDCDYQALLAGVGG